MTNITIIGWYGTETIGDRAILAGLINSFAKVYDEFSINLGSLYPDFTRRTLIEDKEFYLQIGEAHLKGIRIFNSMDKASLKDAIKTSNLVAVGGGPLMDLAEMHMLRYAFRFAKQSGIHTALLGCGWGPLRKDEFIKCATDLVRLSDIVIFRDSISRQECLNHISKPNLLSAVDPAFFCADFFRNNFDEISEKFIAVNFRDASLDQYDANAEIYERKFTDILVELLKTSELPILLIPMHTFHIGGDDRDLLNRLAFKLNSPRIRVQNNPPSLVAVMKLYRNASFAVGMRFHAVLLQTVLNDNNYIIDYTDPSKGKTIGLLNEMGLKDKYNNRYYSLQNDSGQLCFNVNTNRHLIGSDKIRSFQDRYIAQLSQFVKA